MAVILRSIFVTFRSSDLASLAQKICTIFSSLVHSLLPRKDPMCYFCLVLLCFHALLVVDALWSPARKGLSSWLSFVMSNYDVVTFSLVSWVRCGA